ncbi:MAG: DNA repair protein RecO [Clostridia bacterium]|nr:DNA repair protein RecO [Clostridia bacterium]
MKYEKLRGIVVKSIDYLESDKLLTLLTFERGAVTAKAKGVRKKGAKLSYGARQFFCGDFECVESHGKLIITGVSRLYDFSDIAFDIDKYYTACHFADITSSVIMQDHPDEEMLRFFLNSLHFLLKDTTNISLLTSVYELRTAVLAGFAPVMDECPVCGSVGKEMSFSAENGGMVCCVPGVRLNSNTVKLIEMLTECSMKEVFSLTLPEELLPELSSVSLGYLESVLDRKFTKLNDIKYI